MDNFKLKEKKVFRLIFEFESVDHIENLLEKIGKDLESGTLIINGEWSWGAEVAQVFEEDKS